jgi:hypothetical protein
MCINVIVEIKSNILSNLLYCMIRLIIYSENSSNSKENEDRVDDESSLISKSQLKEDGTPQISTDPNAGDDGSANNKRHVSEAKLVRDDEMETNDKKRVIFLNDDARNAKYPYKSNYIKTTRYNIISFLPVALFKQFLRVANVYFLIIAVLQSIPAISPLNPATAYLPLAFVLAVSLVREGIEDYRRYRSDK